MADAREVLEMMKQVALSRIALLKEGVTFYDETKRANYLREYEGKVRDIEDLMRRMTIRLVHSRKDSPEN
jgi:hypothetical protein